jgi:glycosyltransferase involved in cell wall biosynthesis
MTPKVSVIVTIYNREKYIESCAISLFEQTMNDMEYIFVDDASTDKSLLLLEDVLKKFPHRKAYTKIIHLTKNGGVSNARQIGLLNATGEFVIHADSDDWVDNNMYEELYKKAIETKADIVGCNFIHEYSNSHYLHYQQYCNSKEENIRQLLRGAIHPSLCTSLARMSIIKDNDLSFPIGFNMGEDLLFNLKLYVYSNIIAFIDTAPYHYRHTEDSSSFDISIDSVNSGIKIAKMIESFMRTNKIYDYYSNDIEYRKFSMKSSLIWDLSDYEKYNLWLKIFPETHKLIWSFKQINWKLRLELWLASHHMYYIAKCLMKLLIWQHKVRTI